jgi:hypothetical protein
MTSTRRRDNYFSDEMCSDAALHYRVSVEALSQESWNLVIDGAWEIAQERPVGRVSSSSRLPVAQLPEADERELLLETTVGVDVEDDEEVDWDALSLDSPVEVCEFISYYEC